MNDPLGTDGIPVPNTEQVVGLYFMERIGKKFADRGLSKEKVADVAKRLEVKDHPLWSNYVTALNSIETARYVKTGKISRYGMVAYYSQKLSDEKLNMFIFNSEPIRQLVQNDEPIVDMEFISRMTFIRQLALESALSGNLQRVKYLADLLSRCISKEPFFRCIPSWFHFLERSTRISMCVANSDGGKNLNGALLDIIVDTGIGTPSSIAPFEERKARPPRSRKGMPFIIKTPPRPSQPKACCGPPPSPPKSLLTEFNLSPSPSPVMYSDEEMIEAGDHSRDDEIILEPIISSSDESLPEQSQPSVKEPKSPSVEKYRSPSPAHARKDSSSGDSIILDDMEWTDEDSSPSPVKSGSSTKGASKSSPKSALLSKAVSLKSPPVEKYRSPSPPRVIQNLAATTDVDMTNMATEETHGLPIKSPLTPQTPSPFRKKFPTASNTPPPSQPPPPTISSPVKLGSPIKGTNKSSLENASSPKTVLLKSPPVERYRSPSPPRVIQNLAATTDVDMTNMATEETHDLPIKSPLTPQTPSPFRKKSPTANNTPPPPPTISSPVKLGFSLKGTSKSSPESASSPKTVLLKSPPIEKYRSPSPPRVIQSLAATTDVDMTNMAAEETHNLPIKSPLAPQTPSPFRKVSPTVSNTPPPPPATSSTRAPSPVRQNISPASPSARSPSPTRAASPTRGPTPMERHLPEISDISPIKSPVRSPSPSSRYSPAVSDITPVKISSPTRPVSPTARARSPVKRFPEESIAAREAKLHRLPTATVLPQRIAPAPVSPPASPPPPGSPPAVRSPPGSPPPPPPGSPPAVRSPLGSPPAVRSPVWSPLYSLSSGRSSSYSVSPGRSPPGTVSPGSSPPGTVSPGSLPPGTVSPGSSPPGTVSLGSSPPAAMPPPRLVAYSASPQEESSDEESL